MSIYKAKEFNIPKIEGISEKQIEEHLKLYNGYVTHTNKILEQLSKLDKEEGDSYLRSELQRRLGFEFCGMKNHEYYFGALEGGLTPPPEKSLFVEAINKQYGGAKEAKIELEKIAMSRGSGWTILYWDKNAERFQMTWVDEHHLGHLSSLDIIIAIDMWEHAFMVDYLPGEKKKYFESYLEAINWEKIENWFKQAI